MKPSGHSKAVAHGGVAKASSSRAQPAGSSKATKAKAKEKRTDSNGRIVRYKAQPTIKDLERIERALPGSGHRLFLVARKPVHPPGSPTGAREEFTVLGHTGNVYTVNIGCHQNCNCPDFQKGNLCKHILFVMLRVLKRGRNDHVVWQRALLRSEADDVLSASSAAVDAAVMADKRVQEQFERRVTGASSGAGSSGAKARAAEGDCPICFDDLQGAEATDACRTCGNHVHSGCMKTWKTQRRAQGQEITCVYCRSPWEDVAGGTQAGAYVNLKDVSEAHRHGRDRPADYYSGLY